MTGVTQYDDSLEKRLSELCDESQINSYLHKKAYEYYTSRNIRYQLPIIILSALSGTGNFISTSFPIYSTTIILMIGGISIFTSIISSIAQFLKISQLSESHRISYISWDKFYSMIKFKITERYTTGENLNDFLGSENRSKTENLNYFLSIIVPEYQKLKEISATIPAHIYSDFEKLEPTTPETNFNNITLVNGNSNVKTTVKIDKIVNNNVNVDVDDIDVNDVDDDDEDSKSKYEELP